MFKRCLAILLIVVLTATGFQRYFVYAGFEFNHNYIAKELCVNRSRPWMHCNGRCYFMKKIQQAADDEKKQEAKDNLSRLEVSFFEEPFKLAFVEPTLLSTHKSIIPFYGYKYSSRYIDSIFKPPRLIA